MEDFLDVIVSSVTIDVPEKKEAAIDEGKQFYRIF